MKIFIFFSTLTQAASLNNGIPDMYSIGLLIIIAHSFRQALMNTKATMLNEYYWPLHDEPVLGHPQSYDSCDDRNDASAPKLDVYQKLTNVINDVLDRDFDDFWIWNF